MLHSIKIGTIQGDCDKRTVCDIYPLAGSVPATLDVDILVLEKTTKPMATTPPQYGPLFLSFFQLGSA